MTATAKVIEGPQSFTKDGAGRFEPIRLWRFTQDLDAGQPERVSIGWRVRIVSQRGAEWASFTVHPDVESANREARQLAGVA